MASIALYVCLPGRVSTVWNDPIFDLKERSIFFPIPLYSEGVWMFLLVHWLIKFKVIFVIDSNDRERFPEVKDEIRTFHE